MKRSINKKIVLLSCCMIILFGVFLVSKEVKAATPHLSKKEVTLYIGQTFKLKMENCSEKKVQWTSTNNNIVTVNKQNGIIKGKRAGKVYVKAIIGKRTYHCKVTVKKMGVPVLNPIKYWRSGTTASGVQYGTSWRKISGVDGYQVQKMEYGWKGSKGSKDTYFTKSTNASIWFSDTYKFGFRSRAYKIINGKKVFGSYSKWVWKTMYY